MYTYDTSTWRRIRHVATVKAPLPPALPADEQLLLGENNTSCASGGR